jgi:hypothetical protein
MPDPLEDLYKILAPIGTTVTMIGGLVTQAKKRLNQLREISDHGGQQGAFFYCTYTIPQYLYSFVLVLFGLVGFGALLGGIAEMFKPPRYLPFLTSLFDTYSFQFLMAAIIVFIAAGLNVLSWIAIALLVWIPAAFLPLKQSAAWYNLWEFAHPLGEPTPLFINRQGISTLADVAIERLETGRSGRDNYAEVPAELNLDQRANAALIGCILEKEYGLRGWPKPKWRLFYAAVAAAEVNGQKLVSPEYLTGTALKVAFYEILRQELNRVLPDDESKMPDSAEARDELSRAIKLLVNDYEGSARNLARVWWSINPNLRLAFVRSKGFQPMDSRSMVPQFLKLAVRWGVWPGAKLGNFIYPYAAYLGVLLFERHALVTLLSVKSFAFKDEGQLAAYREAMRRVVSKAHQTLSRSLKPQHVQILKSYPSEWELAAEVDFVLWDYSSEVKKQNSLREWTLDSYQLVTRKDAKGI